MKKLPVFILSVLFTFFALAESYDIKFSRAEKVGQKYRFSGQIIDKKTAKVTLDGKVIQNNSDEVVFDILADAECLKVGEDGSAISMNLTIKSFTVKVIPKNPVAQNILKPGTVVSLKRIEGLTVYSANGKFLAEKEKAALKMFIKLDLKEVKDDDVFGPDGKKKVGDSWKINKDLALKDFAKNGLAIKPDSFDGSVKIKEKKNIEGVDYLLLTGVMTCTDMPLPEQVPLPPGSKVEKSSMATNFSGHFPVDTTVLPLDSKTDMKSAFLVDIPRPGSTMKLDFSMSRTKEIKRSLK